VIKSGDFIRGDRIEPGTPQLVIFLTLCHGCMYKALDTCNRGRVVERQPLAAESRVRSPRIKSADFITGDLPITVIFEFAAPRL